MHLLCKHVCLLRINIRSSALTDAAGSGQGGVTTAESPSGGKEGGNANQSTRTQPLLTRWENILLADTLCVSLDPVVAHAKRVIHLKELEMELRDEQQASW